MSVSFSTITQKARLQPIAATSIAMRRALAYIPPTTVSALKNGVQIAAEENPNAKFATVGIYLDVGTKNEQRHNNGLLQVLFQSSLNGTVGKDRKALSAAVDEIGGHLMTKVGREHSYLAIKCARENVQKAVAILSDMVRNADLSAENVKSAKKAAEFARHQSDELVDDLTMDNLHICAYDATDDGGLGLSLNGTHQGIQAVSEKELDTFRTTHFTGPRMLLVGSGAVNHGELEKYGEQFLGDVSNANNKPKPNARYVGGDYRLWNLRMKTAHIAWAVETMGAASGDNTALQLATQIHGGFHRSQHELAQHAVQRATKVFSSIDFGTTSSAGFPCEAPETTTGFFNQYEDTGLVGQYIVARTYKTAPDLANSLWDILQYSMCDWARLAQKSVHNQELDQAKVNMKSQLLFNQDGATNSFEDIGKQVLHFGRRVPLDEMYARIDDITPTNLMEVLQHYYYARRPVVSAYGYIYIFPAYDGICHWTWKYWY